MVEFVIGNVLIFKALGGNIWGIADITGSLP
jgi:hypothetical protein